jgi:hypothetical protein
MAVYAGRDVNKLKSKGGKWKYAPPSFIPLHIPFPNPVFVGVNELTSIVQIHVRARYA